MAYNYRSRRQARKLANKSKTNFIITLILVAVLLYAALMWLLPLFINGLGSIKNFTKTDKKTTVQTTLNSSLAPPVLNIAYEATNSSEIDIRGFSTPHSKVALYLDDEKVDTVDVSSDGAFEFKNISLSLGTNNIYGKSIDEEDRESLPSKTFKLLYDNENPPLNIKEPEDDKKIQGGDKKIRVSGQTEQNAQVFVNGSLVIVDKDGNFSTETFLNDGENNLNIKSVDKATNFTEISRKVTYTP